MFVAVFAFMFATTFAAELPSYINVCSRRSPNLNQCVTDNIENLRDRICGGVEELSIPVFEPVKLDRLDISLTNNSRIYIDNIQITGICAYKCKAVVDVDKLIFALNFSFGRIGFNATYDVDLHILVPLAAKAPLYFTSNNVTSHVSIYGKKVTKNGKEYVYGSEARTKINVNEFTLLSKNKNEITEFDQIIDNIISTYPEEITRTIQPAFEKEISKLTLSIFNGICKRYTYEEIMPNRE